MVCSGICVVSFPGSHRQPLYEPIISAIYRGGGVIYTAAPGWSQPSTVLSRKALSDLQTEKAVWKAAIKHVSNYLVLFWTFSSPW